MNPWKPILAAIVIFAAGVLTGGLLVSYVDHVSAKNQRAVLRELSRNLTNNPSRDASRPLMAALPGRIPRLSEDFLRKLDAEVKLTEGQRERIKEIIAQGQVRNKEIWERIAPELRHELADAQKRIREILTPEQREVFERLMTQTRPPQRRNTEDPKRRPLVPEGAPQ